MRGWVSPDLWPFVPVRLINAGSRGVCIKRIWSEASVNPGFGRVALSPAQRRETEGVRRTADWTTSLPICLRSARSVTGDPVECFLLSRLPVVESAEREPFTFGSEEGSFRPFVLKPPSTSGKSHGESLGGLVGSLRPVIEEWACSLKR